MKSQLSQEQKDDFNRRYSENKENARKAAALERQSKLKCDRCGSNRILSIDGHTSDSFDMQYKDMDYDGYVPYNLNIGGNDDIEMNFCLDCGKIQGNFPITEETVETEFNGGEDNNEEENEDGDDEE